MKEPGFQLRTKDQPRPPIYFTAELYKDGELRDEDALNTDYSDAAIVSLVDRWVGVHGLTEADHAKIVEQLKKERDVRCPPPRML